MLLKFQIFELHVELVSKFGFPGATVNVWDKRLKCSCASIISFEKSHFLSGDGVDFRRCPQVIYAGTSSSSSRAMTLKQSANDVTVFSSSRVILDGIVR